MSIGLEQLNGGVDEERQGAATVIGEPPLSARPSGASETTNAGTGRYVPTWQEAAVLEGALKSEPEGERRERMQAMFARYEKRKRGQVARVEGFYGEAGLEGFFENLEPEARERWEPLLANAHNREEVIAGGANIAWFAAVRPDLAENALADWAPYRAAVAESLGYTGEGPISEKELYGRIQGQVTAKKTRAQRGDELALTMWRAGLEGSSEHWLDAYRSVGVPVFDDPNQPKLEWPREERDFYRAQGRAAFAQGAELRERIAPVVARVLRSMAADTNAFGRGSNPIGLFDEAMVSPDELVETLATFSDEERQIILSEVARLAQDSEFTQFAREEKGAAQKVGEKFGRFVAEMWRNTTTDASRVDALAEAKHALDAQSQGERLFVREGRAHELFTGKQLDEQFGVWLKPHGQIAREGLGVREATKEEVEAFRERTSEEEKRFVIEGELRALAEGEIDPARLENWFLDNLAEAPGQLAYMAQMRLPFGIGYALFYRGNVAMRTKELMSRRVPLHKARDMARWSSIGEGLIELAEAKMAFGKVPGFLKKALNGPMKSLATRDVAKRAGTLFAAEYATQNLQEFAQDVSTLIMQDWAANDKDVPHTRADHWDEFWSSRLDTAVVLLPFAFLGTGLAVGVNDRAWAKNYLEDRRIALANGFVPEVADRIATLAVDGKVQEAVDLTQEAWSDPQRRRPTRGEQLAAIDELAFEAERAHGEFIDSGRVRQREGGVYAVHDGEGELVDIFNESHEAFSFAAEVKEREDALAAEAEEARQAEETAKQADTQEEQAESGAEIIEQEEAAGEESVASGPRAHPKFEGWVSDDGSQFVANQTEGSPLLLWDAFGREKRAQFAQYAGVELSEAKWQQLPLETRERLTEAFVELDRVREVWGAMDRAQRQALFPIAPKTDPVTRAVLRDLVATADISLQPAGLLDIAAALKQKEHGDQGEAGGISAATPVPTTPTPPSKPTRAQASFAKLWDSWTVEVRKVYASSFGIAKGYNKKWAKLEPEARVQLLRVADYAYASKRAWDKADVAERKRIATEGGISEYALANHLADLLSKRWDAIAPVFWPKLVMGHRILEGLRNPKELGRPDAATSEQELPPRDPVVTAKIQEVIDSADEAYTGPRVKNTIGPVSEEVAAVVEEALGVDATGYQHSIDTNSVKHIFERHGQRREKRERARGQIPITAEDIKAIPLIVASPDSVEHVGKSQRGFDVLRYSKHMPDGTVLYLEEVHTQSRELAAKTLYKKDNSAGGNAPASSAVLSLNVQDGSGVTASSESKSPDVKSDTELASPLNLRQPNAAATSLEGTPETKGKKPVSSTAVLNSFAKVAVAVGRDKRSVNRVGFIRGKNALGVYNPGSQVTRIRTAGDTTTGAHELAHLIDDALWGRDFWKKKGLSAGDPIMLGEGHWKSNALNLSDEARGELRKLGNDLYKEGEPHNGYHSEGFAEFVRLWLTDEAQAKEKAPQFSKFWEEQVLGKHKNLKKAVEEASALAHHYLAQGAFARGLAGIVKQPSTAAKVVEGTKREVSQFRKKWVEAGAAIEDFRDEAARLRGDEGGKLPVALDPMESYRFFRIGAGTVVEQMARFGMIDAGRNYTGVAPLNDAFNLVGNKQADAFVVYLWAKRTVALYDDPRNGPRNSGLAIEDARHILEKHGTPQFEKAAGIFYAWGEGLLDYIAEQSPALAEMVARIREVDPGSYIPLKREFAEIDRQFRGNGANAARAQLTKRLKGSGRRIKHPVESMLVQAKDMVHKAHQRRVIDQILHLARTVKGLGHLAVEVPVAQVPIAKRPMAELLQKVEGAIGSRGELAKLLEETGQGDLLEEVVTFFGPAAEPKAGEWPILPVWEEGKMKWFELDPELYAALAHMDNQTMSATTKWLGQKWASSFRLGVTGLNAGFSMWTNPSRDVMTLVLNSRANGSRGEVFVAWLAAMRDTVVYQMSGGRIGNNGGDIMRRLGIEMAQPLGQDTKPLERAARRIMNGGKWNPLSLADWADGLRSLLSMSEMAPRLAEVRLVAKMKGIDLENMTQAEAITVGVPGMEVTADFKQAGTSARFWNAIIPFLNAGIQGKVSHARAFKRNPVNFLITAFSMTVGGLVLWSLYRDEEWWQEMTPDERYGYVYIPLGKELIRIPLPFEVGGLFVSGPMALIDAWYQEEPERAAGWLRTFLEDIGQFEMVESETLGGRSVPVPQLPVLGRLAAEQASNKSFHYGSPIVPRWQQDLPYEEQYGPYTTRAAVEIGQALGVSPRRVEHAVRSVFGGVAMDVAALAGRGNPRVVKRDWEAADTPVFGRLFQRGGQAARRPKSVDTLYEVYDEALKLNRSRVKQETELQRQQRLMMNDAVKAIGLLGDVAQATADRDSRQRLQSEQIAIAKEVVELVRAGKVNRQLGKDEKAKAAHREAQTLHKLGGEAAKSTGTRQLRAWMNYGEE